MKKLIAMFAFPLAMAAGQAAAHDSPAKHGGMVQSSDHISFELVHKDGQATIYVDDHGKAVPMAGASATLTVLKSGEKSEIPMTAGGANTLVAKTGDKVGPGAKVVAAVVFPDKRTASVRYAIKE